MIVNYAI